MSEPAVSWRDRLQALGTVGLVLHFTLYGLTLVGFYLALQSPAVRAIPWVAEHMGQGSTMFSAWVLGRLTFIPRAAFTCAVTPWLARRWSKGP